MHPHTAPAPPVGSARRRNALLAAGLTDSLGLAIGWTAMSLHTVTTRGLAAFGMLSAAMLLGVALSAPFTGWLSSKADGKRLLRSTALGEALLRATSFVLVFAGAPLGLIAGLVAASNVLGWTGFAGMRAEVSLLGGGARWLSAYTAAIAAAEAAGAFLAASAPTGADWRMGSGFVIAVGVAYALSLLPTLVVAAGARAPRADSGRPSGSVRGRGRLLLGGAALMALASGPTLLAIGLAEELHGRAAVGPAMLLFAAGSLLGPGLAGWLVRVDLPTAVVWSFLGVLMLVGWGLAPVSLVGLLVAQLVSGAGVGAFEGVMDARTAERGSPDTITGGMAWAGATRALGSAVAVFVAPTAVMAVGVDRTAAFGIVGLAGFAFLLTSLSAAFSRGWRHRRPLITGPERDISWLTRPDHLVVLTPDDTQFALLAGRYFGVEVHQARTGADLRRMAAGDEVPIQVVVGDDVAEVDLVVVESLTSTGGRWHGTRVQLLEAAEPQESNDDPDGPEDIEVVDFSGLADAR